MDVGVAAGSNLTFQYSLGCHSPSADFLTPCQDNAFPDGADALRHAIIKLWPPGQASSTLKRELAYLLLDDPDCRLRMCHVEDLLQTRLPGQPIHTQLQSVLLDPRVSCIFRMEPAAACDWGWRVLRLNCAELLREATAVSAVKLESKTKSSIPETAVLLSIESTWPKYMVDDDEYLAVVIAYIIAVKRDLKCQLPPYSLHLTDVGGWLRTFSVNDLRLADIFPRCQKRASKRPRISEFLLQAKFRPYFRLRDSAVRKSEKVVSLVVERFLQNLSLRDGRNWLTETNSSFLLQTGSAPANLFEKLSLTCFPADDVSKDDMALPNFLFDYETTSQEGCDQNCMGKQDRDQSETLSPFCTAFSLPMSLETSEVARRDVRPAVVLKENSFVAGPGTPVKDEAPTVVPNSPFACGSWQFDDKGAHSNFCSFNYQEIFSASDSLFSNVTEKASLKTEVPKAVASCWGSNMDEASPEQNNSLTESISWQSSASPDLTCSLPKALDSSLFESSLSTVKSLLPDKNGEAPLFEAPTLQSCYTLDANLQNSLASLTSVLGNGSCNFADLLQHSLLSVGDTMVSDCLQQALEHVSSMQLLEQPSNFSSPKECDQLLSDELKSTGSCNLFSGYAAAATAAKYGQDKSPLGLPMSDAYGQFSEDAAVPSKSFSKLCTTLKEEIYSIVQKVQAIKLEDFDDGVVFQLLARKSEEEAIAALRTLPDQDLSSIQHMAAFINHVVKNYQPGTVGTSARGSVVPAAVRASSTPISAKAMLQKLPSRVYKRLEGVINSCSYLEWKHFDAGVVKVLVQLSEVADADVIEELDLLQTTDLSNVEYMPAYLNKRLNNRLWSRRKASLAVG